MNTLNDELTDTDHGDNWLGAARILSMLALIVAGEAVFFLPFVLARVFRPTLLDVLQLTNLEYGAATSLYGIVAMIAYFFGGPIADRFSARKLMTIALFATSLGGIVMASSPSVAMLRWLYAFWGITTVLLFWAPLIRATRLWSAGHSSGRAFGILDGGRGLVAALIGTVAVAVFSMLLGDDPKQATAEQNAAAFTQVIWVFTVGTFATAILVWTSLPDEDASGEEKSSKLDATDLVQVFKMPSVWIQSVIVICAYAGYKGLDDVPLYARDALGFDEVEAAKLGVITMWVRPIAAIVAGFLADAWSTVRMTAVCFGVLAVGSLVVCSGAIQPGMNLVLLITVCGSSAAVCALRGLYFAIMDEGNIPFAYTGTAVGIVSFVGYTPDIFMGPVMGALTDRSPGALGHQHVFAVIAAFAVAGFLAACTFGFLSQRSMPVTERT